jgi:hypothetical protein
MAAVNVTAVPGAIEPDGDEVTFMVGVTPLFTVTVAVLVAGAEQPLLKIVAL